MPFSRLANRTKLELKTVNTGNEADLRNIPTMSRRSINQSKPLFTPRDEGTN